MFLRETPAHKRIVPPTDRILIMVATASPDAEGGRST